MATTFTFLFVIFTPTIPVFANSGGGTTVCDGFLPPGTYHAIVVPDGDTCLLGVILSPPQVVGQVTVNGGIFIGTGATFYMGYEGGPSTGTINGGITADNAGRVFIHNANINGGVTIQGGIGPFSSTCTYSFVSNACSDDFEDNTINGMVTINGYNGFFLGFMRNHDSGTVTISGNTLVDQIDIGSLIVHGNLICSGNTPTENMGGSPGLPSTVTGQDTCNGT